MKYIAYHRTSTLEQHLERGIAEITQFCSDNSIQLYKGKVYCDSKLVKTSTGLGIRY